MELAFLSALLEQRQPNEKPKHSHKMKMIRNFLEEVVKLVPLESLFYALGCGDDDIIEDCCEAFMTSDLQDEEFTPSEMLLNGMNLALQRLATGRRFREQDFQRPHTFSDRIADMILQTRYLLGDDDCELETASSQYIWQTQHHRVLYSEVVASQHSPHHFSRHRHSSLPVRPSKSEIRGKNNSPRQASLPSTDTESLMSSRKPVKTTKHKPMSAGTVRQGQKYASTKPVHNTMQSQRSSDCRRLSSNRIPIPLYCSPVMVYSQFHPYSSHRIANISSCRLDVIDYLTNYLQSQTHICRNAISSVPISSVYPACSSQSMCSNVMPPIDLLSSTRAELEHLAKKAIAAEKEEQDGLHDCSGMSSSKSKTKSAQKLSGTTLHNRKMLDMITDIRKKQKVCSTLLGAFMEAQERVPLVKSVRDTAQAIGKTAIAVGVWALLSMPYFDMESLLSVKFSSLIVEVARFIHGTYSASNRVDVGDEYAGKLQFLLQGMVSTVSCNSRYISYSLEQQLQEQCTKLNIDASTDLKKLIDNWDVIFNKDVLSLVTPQSRGLVARWLKWSLLVHNL